MVVVAYLDPRAVFVTRDVSAFDFDDGHADVGPEDDEISLTVTFAIGERQTWVTRAGSAGSWRRSTGRGRRLKRQPARLDGLVRTRD